MSTILDISFMHRLLAYEVRKAIGVIAVTSKAVFNIALQSVTAASDRHRVLGIKAAINVPCKPATAKIMHRVLALLLSICVGLLHSCLKAKKPIGAVAATSKAVLACCLEEQHCCKNYA